MRLAEDVVFMRRGRLILDKATLVVPLGITTLVGPNGAGKTTLFECIAGNLRILSGQVKSDADPGFSVGYVPQDPVLPKTISVLAGLQYASWLRGASWKDSLDLSESALAQVDLLSRKSDRIGSLSGGMRRRFAVAIALAQNPSVILLDESFVGLDPIQRTELSAVIREVSLSIPVVISTHVLTDILELGGSVVVLKNGQLSTPLKVTEIPANSSEGPTMAELQAWYLSVVSN